MMLAMSKIVPSSVQTGSSKGVNEMPQQWYGSLLKAAGPFFLKPPHSSRHSVVVRYIRSLLCCFFPIFARG
jgi:hypothetical protein